MGKITVRASYDDLVHLIGRDDEVSLELRNSIVQMFAQKYLKGVIDGTARDRIDRLIEHRLEAEIGTVSQTWQGTTVKISPRFQQRLEEIVESRLRQMVNDAVATVWEKWEPQLENFVMRSVQARVNFEVDKVVNQKVREKLDAMIEASGLSAEYRRR